MERLVEGVSDLINQFYLLAAADFYLKYCADCKYTHMPAYLFLPVLTRPTISFSHFASHDYPHALLQHANSSCSLPTALRTPCPTQHNT